MCSTIIDVAHGFPFLTDASIHLVCLDTGARNFPIRQSLTGQDRTGMAGWPFLLLACLPAVLLSLPVCMDKMSTD